MPELPEVEILARHLAPLLLGKTIRAVEVRRSKVLRPTSARQLASKLTGAKFIHLRRRGKYLLFDLKKNGAGQFTCMGHLGMTGRMFLQPHNAALPKHAALVLDLGKLRFVYGIRVTSGASHSTFPQSGHSDPNHSRQISRRMDLRWH